MAVQEEKECCCNRSGRNEAGRERGLLDEPNTRAAWWRCLRRARVRAMKRSSR